MFYLAVSFSKDFASHAAFSFQILVNEENHRIEAACRYEHRVTLPPDVSKQSMGHAVFLPLQEIFEDDLVSMRMFIRRIFR